MKATLETVYLYPDGHAVAVYRQYHAKSGKDVQWVELHERWMPNAFVPQWNASDKGPDGRALGARGRIILKGRVATLVRKATHLSVYRENNSQALDRLGLTQRSLIVTVPGGEFSLDYIEGVTSGDFTIQDACFDGSDVSERWEDVKHAREWGTSRVAKVHPVRASAEV